MLKWRKDALVQRLVEEVRLNARRYDKLISTILALNTAIKSLDRKVDRFMATQEEQLQEVQTLLRDTVAPGVTEIIKRLNSITVPTDNPAIQDEIDGIRTVAKEMAEEIQAKLNPVAPNT